jgi:hypothetical protein
MLLNPKKIPDQTIKLGSAYVLLMKVACGGAQNIAVDRPTASYHMRYYSFL